jgi:hypothetical protein
MASALGWSATYTVAEEAAPPAATVIYQTTAVSLAVDAVNLYWIDDGAMSGSVVNAWEYHK